MWRDLTVAAAALMIAAGVGLLVGLRLFGMTPPVDGSPLTQPPTFAPAVPDPVVGDGQVDPRARSARVGKPLVTMVIPALGKDWRYVAFEGVTAPVLAKGPGHYPSTPLPGQPGNSAFAAHRWQGPFYNFERLHEGDVIVLAQGKARWVYRIVAEPQIVDPDDVWVIDDVPGYKGVAMLTLTTCWPKDGSSHREFVRARLIDRSTS